MFFIDVFDRIVTSCLITQKCSPIYWFEVTLILELDAICVMFFLLALDLEMEIVDVIYFVNVNTFIQSKLRNEVFVFCLSKINK